MLSNLDRLLLGLYADSPQVERAAACDLLLEAGRPEEAARVLVPGRLLVRYAGSAWVSLAEPTRLRHWWGQRGYVDRHRLGVIVYCGYGPRRRNRVLLKPDASLRLRQHSPTGFDWGYSGSGPAQLALALLLDCCGEELAIAHYQTFTTCAVAQWKVDQWHLAEETIWALVDNCSEVDRRRIESLKPWWLTI